MREFGHRCVGTFFWCGFYQILKGSFHDDDGGSSSDAKILNPESMK